MPIDAVKLDLFTRLDVGEYGDVAIAFVEYSQVGSLRRVPRPGGTQRYSEAYPTMEGNSNQLRGS